MSLSKQLIHFAKAKPWYYSNPASGRCSDVSDLFRIDDWENLDTAILKVQMAQENSKNLRRCESTSSCLRLVYA